MKIGFIQYDVDRSEEKNLEIIDTMLSSLNARIAVLPELSMSGYLFENKEELRKKARKIPGSLAVQKMAVLSRKYNCALIFGLAEEEDGHLYNTAVVVDQGKYIGRYRKMHLSDYEKQFFERGTENKVFDIAGIKAGVQICFDLWFPEVSRKQVCQGARLLCALANFGAPTTYHLSQTRAVENLTPLVLCNRIGHEEICGMDADFLGKSSIMDCRGERIETAPAGFEQASSREISLDIPRKNAICANFEEEMRIHHPDAFF